MKLQDNDYKVWLKDLKENFKSIQQKAVIAVNQQLLLFYWTLGREITLKQAEKNGAVIFWSS